MRPARHMTPFSPSLERSEAWDRREAVPPSRILNAFEVHHMSRFVFIAFIICVLSGWCGYALTHAAFGSFPAQEVPGKSPPKDPDPPDPAAEPPSPGTQKPAEPEPEPEVPEEPAQPTTTEPTGPSEDALDVEAPLPQPETNEFIPIEEFLPETQAPPERAETPQQQPIQPEDHPAETADSTPFIRAPMTAYELDAQLDPKRRIISGKQRVRFTNRTGLALNRLVFQLDLNAFKNEASSFWQAWNQLGHRPTSGSGSWGTLDVGRIEVNGTEHAAGLTNLGPALGNSLDETVAELPLDQPLVPGETITLELEFTAKLPELIYQTGVHRDFFFVSHWFPRLAPLHRAATQDHPSDGWICRPFRPHDGGSGDFADFEVALTVPKDWAVGATGKLIRKDEAEAEMTWVFSQASVPDFAFCTSPDLISVRRRFEPDEWFLPSERAQAAAHLGVEPEALDYRAVDVVFLLQARHQKDADRFVDVAFQGLKLFGLQVGPYPFSTLTCVDPAWGVEPASDLAFPTLVTAGLESSRYPHRGALEYSVFSGIAHQYWTDAIQITPSDALWLGAGLTRFTALRMVDLAVGPQSLVIALDDIPLNLSDTFGYAPLSAEDWFLIGLTSARGAQPLVPNDSASMTRASSQSPWFDSLRAAAVLHQLRMTLGEAPFDRALHAYFQSWRGNRPTARDFQAIVQEVTETDLTDFFDAFVFGSAFPDFAVIRIRNVPLAKSQGYLETRDGRQMAATPNQAIDLFNSLGAHAFRSSVVLANLGSTPYPIDVGIEFQDAPEQIVSWDGRPGFVQWSVESAEPITRVIIDPNDRFFLDLNPLNDSKTCGLPPMKHVARWSKAFVFLQHLLLTGVF